MSHNLTEQASPLLGARLSNVDIDSQIGDDRDALTYVQSRDDALPISNPSRLELGESQHGSRYENITKECKQPPGELTRPEEVPAVSKKSQDHVSWSSLPHKGQLAILTLARLAEPVVYTSLQSYMFFMLKSFDKNLSDATVSSQAGMLSGSFTFAQCLTAVVWGRLADKEWMGRKRVIMIGLLGTLISSVGFGFCKSFGMAMFCRIIGGALNGNVGVMRTMISEIVVEKKYLTKAFLVMPVTFNVGVLVGPVLGGWLQDPVNSFPHIFGRHSILGGKDGVGWMRTFPYALPNLVCGFFLLSSIALVFLGLEDTHMDRRHRKDMGRSIGRSVTRMVQRLFRCKSGHKYARLNTDDEDTHELENARVRRSKSVHEIKTRAKLPYRRIFTRNVMCTFMVHGLLAMQLGAFHNLWFLFLSTPRYDPKHPTAIVRSPQKLPFLFTGGLGLTPSTIGFALGIIGAIGLCMQFGVYSRVTDRMGLLRTYRRSLLFFPLAYALIPYVAMLPTHSKAPKAADGPLMWIGISSLLFIVVAGRTFSLPISQILINNCSPHPSVLSSVHGLAQSVSAGARTLGPIVWSTIYGLGLHKGVVGLGFWTLCIESLLAVGASWLVYEGNGHEIRLEGDP